MNKNPNFKSIKYLAISLTKAGKTETKKIMKYPMTT